MEKNTTFIWKRILLLYGKEYYFYMEKNTTFIWKRILLLYGKEYYFYMEKNTTFIWKRILSNSAKVFIIINSLSYFCSMKPFTKLRSQDVTCKGPNVLSPGHVTNKLIGTWPNVCLCVSFGQYNQIHSH